MSGGTNMGSGITGMHKINNKIYNKNRIDETVATNTTETWVFNNSQGGEPHPIHLHGVHFQVIDRTGGRGQLIVSKSGWKDTFLVMPGETVKIIVPFSTLKGVFFFTATTLNTKMKV